MIILMTTRAGCAARRRFACFITLCRQQRRLFAAAAVSASLSLVHRRPTLTHMAAFSITRERTLFCALVSWSRFKAAFVMLVISLE